MSCVEMPEYSRLDVVVGESVELLCNTSLTSDIMWSYDTDEGFVAYVYLNGLIDSDRPGLATRSTADGFHSLVIAAAELSDSGLYNCYGGNGKREVGYQLIAGMRSTPWVKEHTLCTMSRSLVEHFPILITVL